MMLPCGTTVKILAEIVGYGETGTMASTVVQIDEIFVDVWSDEQVLLFVILFSFSSFRSYKFINLT